jgi:hypothetical protein
VVWVGLYIALLILIGGSRVACRASAP